MRPQHRPATRSLRPAIQPGVFGAAVVYNPDGPRQYRVVRFPTVCVFEVPVRPILLATFAILVGCATSDPPLRGSDDTPSALDSRSVGDDAGTDGTEPSDRDTDLERDATDTDRDGTGPTSDTGDALVDGGGGGDAGTDARTDAGADAPTDLGPTDAGTDGSDGGRDAGDDVEDDAADGGDGDGDAGGDDAGDDTPPETDTGDPPVDRPANVIVIFADDLGYGHLGSYGQRCIRTPRLDTLAAEGARYTQFYSGAAWCPPARSVLLTGLHTGHTWVRNSARDFAGAGTLLPGYFGDAGYRTAMFGKWGFNPHVGGASIRGATPGDIGFDEFTGLLTHRDAHVYYLDSVPPGSSASPYYGEPGAQRYVHRTLFTQVRDGDLTELPIGTTTYTQDVFVDRALAWIDDHRTEPFFLFLPWQLPHAELVPPPEGIWPEYEGGGPCGIAEEPWTGNAGYQRHNAQPYATFATMVARFDRDVGRIIDQLEAAGLADDTWVFVTSDNGPHSAGARWSTDPFDGNADLRGRKFQLYEGGIRVPFIAWAPGRIPAGRVVDTPRALSDLLPTALDAAEISVPGGIDGRSLVPELTGGSVPPHELLMWENYAGTGLQAIRMGNLKVIRVHSPDGDAGHYMEFYDLGSDPAETTDLGLNLGRCEELRTLTAAMNGAHTTSTDGGAILVDPRGPFSEDMLPACQRHGGGGDDVITGDGRPDRIRGFAGNDTIRGAGDSDELFGGQGNDELFGDEGDDIVMGGPGDDTIRGLDGADYVQGNQGNDVVNGNQGRDIVRGGQDDDEVRGGQDDDEVWGDLGNDTIYGDLGNDRLFGGDGNDVFVIRPGDGSDVISDDSGHDTLRCEDGAVLRRTERRGNDEVFFFDGAQVTVEGHHAGRAVEVIDCP